MSEFYKRFSDEEYCKWLEQELFIHSEDYIGYPLAEIWKDYMSSRDWDKWRKSVQELYAQDPILDDAKHIDKPTDR